ITSGALMRPLLFASLVLAACGVSPTATPVTFEADIRPMVVEHCSGCHVAGGIGPFAMGTYEDVTMVASSARAQIESKRMPPYLAARGCTDYLNDISLSDAQIATFGKWVDTGMARGTPTATMPAQQIGGLTRVDRTLSLPEPYTPRNRPDDYRCFVLD